MTKSLGIKQVEEAEKAFKALSHASRRHILGVLNARGGSMTAGEIAGRFGCTWPTTSRHLRLLVEAGLVHVDKKGREWIYVLEREHLFRVVSEWLKWFDPKKKG